MIHVCFSFRDVSGRYAKFAGTTMLSIFDNTSSPVTVHILHDKTLTADDREKFSYLAGRHKQRVKFYDVEKICADKVAESFKLIPELEKAGGAFYSLFAAQVLPSTIEKIIFVTGDVIVNLDVNELWQIDLGEKILAAVTEADNGVDAKKFFLLCSEGRVKPEDYFNSGVLVMNLKLLRGEEEKISDGIKFRGKNPKQKFLEQTVWNYCFSSQALKLPNKFNRFVRVERRGEKILERKIYHYAGGTSNQGLDMSDPFNALWMNYFLKTPWFDAEALGRLYASFQKICDEWKISAAALTNVMPGKMRAFFVEPAEVEAVKNFFDVKDYEKIIPAKNEASVKNLIDSMQNLKGACVFFIMTENFLNKNFPFKQLTDAGFTEGKDFLKAWKFLPSDTEKSFDSFPLIAAM